MNEASEYYNMKFNRRENFQLGVSNISFYSLLDSFPASLMNVNRDSLTISWYNMLLLTY